MQLMTVIQLTCIVYSKQMIYTIDFLLILIWMAFFELQGNVALLTIWFNFPLKE